MPLLRLGIALSAMTFACSKSVIEPPGLPPVVISVQAHPSVSVGGTLRATATASSGVVVWSSDTPALAQVSAAGDITGVAPGQAVIRATSSGATTTISVTVLEPFSDIAIGGIHACALTASGATYCWGANGHYQVGKLTDCRDFCAQPRTPVRTAAGSTFAQVSPGYSNTCAITSAGQMYCWGANHEEYFRTGTEICLTDVVTCAAAPVLIASPAPLVAVGTGARFACALDAAGVAYCWGRDADAVGNLGAPGRNSCKDNTRCNVALEAVSTSQRFTKLSVGNLHSCAITGAGSAYCWGANASGQLGNGSTSGVNDGVATPALVLGGLSFSAISAGEHHTCALTPGGKAYCWGLNEQGQLGTGSAGFQPATSPVAVNTALTFKSITTGANHTCALATDGAAYCWGWNGPDGRLGDGSTTDRLVPVRSASPRVFEQIGARRGYTCGRTSAGRVYCWGQNVYGQLGTGDTNASNGAVRGVAGAP